MRSHLLFGFLAAFSYSVHGFQYAYRIKQDVGGTTLALQHGVGDPASVRFDKSTHISTSGWNFDTEGLADGKTIREAVITPLSDTSKTLVCHQGSKCRLDPEGLKQPFRVTQVFPQQPYFIIEDIVSGAYVTRASDLSLELSHDTSDGRFFNLDDFL
ncbi:hypothetical protein PHISCL_04773 [Aspergillus sclerotialis]|uniref:Uncharacterized protein n=1 Tax=Aspergillus sclerotialis TaxID=2070753 RepID=A0A3A2ZN97_9EURO|nr:hypothetical protein PHISCL_04773 [Aspergillus sclerotialis]